MDISISSIEVIKTLGYVSGLEIRTNWAPFSAMHPETPVLHVQTDDTAVRASLEALVLPASYPLLGAKVFEREGHLDVVHFDLQLPSIPLKGKGSPVILMQAPEGSAELYLIQNLGLVPKVFQMSNGSSPKPTGRCPICFHRQTLGADGNIRKHREDLADWKFKKWCHQGLLQSEDRRVELCFLDENYPAPAVCAGSYLPSLEESPAGIVWSIRSHRQAITHCHASLKKHMEGSVDVLYPYELGPHHCPGALGNGRYHHVIKKDDPRFAKCMAEKIQSIKDRVVLHSTNIQKLRKILNWVNRTHRFGTFAAPLDLLKIDIEHSVGFEAMTPKQAQTMVEELMASPEVNNNPAHS